MEIVWILLPAPFVGYLVADSVRRIFSEDDRLIRKLFVEQPVTALATLTIVGAVVVWLVSEAVRRVL